MGSYRNSRSNRSTFRGNNSKGAPMFDAVCDKCGKDCKVPFRPSGDKPVFCSDCFEKKEGGSDRGYKHSRNDRSNRSSRGKDRSVYARGKDMYDAVCDKCGNDCKVPFKPSEDKPIFCSSCFEKKEAGRDNSGRNSYRKESSAKSENLAPLLIEINQKLEKIFDYISKEEKNLEVKEEIKKPAKTVKKTKTAMKIVKKEKPVKKAAKKTTKKKVPAKKKAAKKTVTKKTVKKSAAKAKTTKKKPAKKKAATKKK